MLAAGISTERLAAVLSEGLDATLPVTTVTTKGGTTFERGGGSDYHARHKYLETALRIGGHEPSRETTIEDSYEERILRLRGELPSDG